MRQKNTTPRRFWLKVIGGMMLASILPVVLLNTAQYRQLRTQTLLLAQREITENTNRSSEAINTLLQQRTERMMLLQRDPIIRESIATLARRIDDQSGTYQRVVKRLDEHVQGWSILQDQMIDMILTDANGRIVYRAYKRNQEPLVGSNIEGNLHAAFMQGVEKLSLSSITQRTSVKETALYQLLLSAPIEHTNGELAGVAILDLNADPILGILEQSGIDTLQILQHDATGIKTINPFYQSPQEVKELSEDFIQHVLDTKTGSKRDENHLYSWHAIPALQLSLVASQSVDDALSTLNDQRQRMLFISITLVIGTMILGYIYSKRVSKRIEDITDTTVQIADGNLAIELNENGNDELSVLAKDMNSLIAQLRQQKQEEEEKKDLLSLGSHQLRSPLNRVAWALQMLESSKKLKPAERHELMQQACVGVRRMRQIVSTILTLSSIERNNLTPQAQKIAVKELLEEVVENYEQDLQSKKQSLTIRCNKTLRISSDRNIIAQVLDNLVGNASKYTPSEGSIVIKAKKDADTLVLSVSDTGFGIPRDQEDKIFQKYCRAKTDDTKHIAGSGLGLYLSKILLTTIQGKIHFTSAAGNGTTFTIILPLSLNV